MDLNHIELSGAQLAGLYTHTLVELAPSEAKSTVAPAPAKRAATAPSQPEGLRAPAGETKRALSFLGQNGRGILVVTAEPELPYLDDADLAFLTNVLGACGLGMGDVAIVNWLQLPAHDGNELTAGLSAEKVLLFSVTPDSFGLPANFPPFQVQQLGGRTYMHAPPLAGIAADKELKKALWLALKKMFGV